jgi:signal transduction histidine kinase
MRDAEGGSLGARHKKGAAGRQTSLPPPANSQEASHAFWRGRATESAARLAELRAQLEQYASLERVISDAVARMTRLGRHERLAGFGPIVAQAAGARDWLLAIARGAELRIEAASARIDTAIALDESSALASCFRRAATIASSDSRAAAFEFREDKLLRADWICAPFAAGAVALGGLPRASRELREKIEVFLARVAPIVSMWLVEQQAEERRALVQQLALRLFAAVDQERARIARDLHDDQAQLLAAARIALEGGRDEARGILRELEQELRRRTRELRPPTLGRLTLREALDGEIARLEEAGVKVTLTWTDDAQFISRPIQELCFRLVREAFSNVIRHARASAVELRLERGGDAARVSIADNGSGIDPANDGGGTGLAGLRERLELMGGTLRINSRPGATRLVAEVPEIS